MVEIAWVELRDGTITSQGSSLVNPQCIIPEEAIAVHKITNSMVKNAPTAKQILPTLFAAWEGAVLVAHNAPYDEGILSTEAARYNMWIPAYPILDTLTLARQVLNVSHYSLKSLCQEMDIPNPQEHRALSDTLATATLFQKLLRIWLESGGGAFHAFARAAHLSRMGQSSRPLQNLPDRMRLLPAALLSHSDVQIHYHKEGRSFVLEGTLECGFHHEGLDYIELWDHRRHGVLLTLRLDHIESWGPLAN